MIKGLEHLSYEAERDRTLYDSKKKVWGILLVYINTRREGEKKMQALFSAVE